MMNPASPTESAADALDDHALMARVARGDHQAFRWLVERHQEAIIATCARMLGDHRDAEDLAQQVFLRVWTHAPVYRPESKFTTYLYTITRHLVFNESRRRSRRREVSEQEREEHGCAQPIAAETAQPDAAILQEELRVAVDQAIAALPEAQRVAVVLRRYEQLSYEEIAEVLEVSLPAVKSLLFRARTTLKEELGRYLQG